MRCASVISIVLFTSEVFGSLSKSLKGIFFSRDVYKAMFWQYMICGLGVTFRAFCVVALLVAAGCGDQQGTSKVSISPASVDLGEVLAGSANEVVFEIRNRSTANLKIDEVALSCGCLNVTRPPDVVPADSSVSLKLVYRAPSTPSIALEFKRIGVTLTGENETHSLSTEIRATSSPPVLLDPPQLRFKYNESEGRVTVRRGPITDAEFRGIKVLEPASTPMSISLVRATADEFELVVNCENVPPAAKVRHNILMSVFAAGKNSLIKCPVEFGPAPISVSPKAIVFRMGDSSTAVNDSVLQSRSIHVEWPVGITVSNIILLLPDHRFSVTKEFPKGNAAEFRITAKSEWRLEGMRSSEIVKASLELEGREFAESIVVPISVVLMR